MGIFARQKCISTCLWTDNWKNMRGNCQSLIVAAVLAVARKDCGKSWTSYVRICGGLAKNRSHLCYHWATMFSSHRNNLYRVSQEERSIFWEVIISVILSKKLYMYKRPVPNGFRDRAISLYSTVYRNVKMHSDKQHAMSSHELQSASMLTVKFLKMCYTT
jgi:hypothetical protein